MDEIAKVALDNEMDLILAHKRSMRLAELTGLSLSAQTSFATAVSEVARNTIDNGKSGSLVLYVDDSQPQRYIVACIKDKKNGDRPPEGLEYAKKLVNKYAVSKKDTETLIELFYNIPNTQKIDPLKLDEWRNIMRNEPAVSPYEEIKRKNEQLQELSNKIQKSEAQYKILTNSLPLIIFSLSQNGQLLYANDGLMRLTGETLQTLNENQWKHIVHPDDYDSFLLLLKNTIPSGATAIKIQVRLKHSKRSEYSWYLVSISPFMNNIQELQYWIGYMVDIHAQKVYEETLKDNIELKEAQQQLKENQQKLEDYIEELNRSNYELQQFAFVTSHDLQEPVRKLLFYSDYLMERYEANFDDKGRDFLKNLHASSYRMRSIIQDLLVYSQINKNKINHVQVDLNEVARQVVQDLEIGINEKQAVLNFEPLPVIEGDQRMMVQLFQNILSNSLKYAKPTEPPRIEVSCQSEGDQYTITFKDNGIGFDDKYSPQIFGLFQRLHSRESYEGTGLGLAICLKIVELHKGSIHAASQEGKGASFFVTLPKHSVK
jgi:PAS domain S-box